MKPLDRAGKDYNGCNPCLLYNIRPYNKEITPPLPVQLVQPLLIAARLEYRTMDTVLKAVGGYGINTQFNGSSVEGSHGIIYGSMDTTFTSALTISFLKTVKKKVPL